MERSTSFPHIYYWCYYNFRTSKKLNANEAVPLFDGCASLEMALNCRSFLVKPGYPDPPVCGQVRIRNHIWGLDCCLCLQFLACSRCQLDEV